MSRVKNKIRNRWISLIVAVVSFFAILWNQPVYRHYILDGKGHLKNLKIIFLSDLHNSVYGKEQSKLLKMIDDEAPDIILIGGDMADEKSSIEGSKKLFEGLEGRYPMYFVSGNHEHWMYESDKVFDLFKSYGINILRNESIQIKIGEEVVTILGVNDPDSTLEHSGEESLTRSLEEAGAGDDAAGYYILLSHRPEHIELYEQYGFDLVLSGHAHGGQVRIPFILNGLYAPNQGFLPEYAGGYYDMNEQLDFIVGRGLSYKKKLPRVCNPPELVVIEFK